MMAGDIKLGDILEIYLSNQAINGSIIGSIEIIYIKDLKREIDLIKKINHLIDINYLIKINISGSNDNQYIAIGYLDDLGQIAIGRYNNNGYLNDYLIWLKNRDIRLRAKNLADINIAIDKLSLRASYKI